MVACLSYGKSNWNILIPIGMVILLITVNVLDYRNDRRFQCWFHLALELLVFYTRIGTPIGGWELKKQSQGILLYEYHLYVLLWDACYGFIVREIIRHSANLLQRMTVP